MRPWSLQTFVGKRRSRKGREPSEAEKSGRPGAEKRELPEPTAFPQGEEDADAPALAKPRSSASGLSSNMGGQGQSVLGEEPGALGGSESLREKAEAEPRDRTSHPRSLQSSASSKDPPRVRNDFSDSSRSRAEESQQSTRETVELSRKTTGRFKDKSQDGLPVSSSVASLKPGSESARGSAARRKPSLHGDLQSEASRVRRSKRSSESESGSDAPASRQSGELASADSRVGKPQSGRRNQERRRVLSGPDTEERQDAGEAGESAEGRPGVRQGKDGTLRVDRSASRDEGSGGRRRLSGSTRRSDDGGGARSTLSRDPIDDRSDAGSRAEGGRQRARTSSTVLQEEGEGKRTETPEGRENASRDSDDKAFNAAMQPGTELKQLIETALHELDGLDKFLQRPDGVATTALEKTRAVHARVGRDTQRLMDVLEESKRAILEKAEKKRQANVSVKPDQAEQVQQALLDTEAREREKEKTGNLTTKLSKALGMKPTAAKRQLQRLAELRRMTADPSVAPAAPAKMAKATRRASSNVPKITAKNSGSVVV
ncbi:hypothetical protein TGMAS_246990 [Toxoplasma gondii MAS]|uniref:Uncharacterized protein n=2 Tax=Toxoplasma gondii TaxID=5811 RepID=A0A086QU50_TOXGO|nr:hypothetical protein TGMAS_246990 [Toxoplasma gondii MAS]PUA90567.1 hypothetical protein TGBR9_246990 [Toxoplasma gondii TgCATBr9]